MTVRCLRLGAFAASLALVTACAAAGAARSATELAPAWFSSGGDRLTYRVYGHGAPVIVVAGGPGLDADYMRPVAEDIAATGHEAVLPDLRGTGGSRAAGKNLDMMTVAGSVADLEALRKALGVEQVALVGHSFGGGVAQVYAQVHPDHVAKLILVDSTGTDLSPAPDPVRAEMWMARLTPKERADYAAARARGDNVAAMRMKFHATIADPVRADAFLAALKPFADPVAQAHISADYRANYRVTQRDPEFQVTIIYGEDDWIRAWQSQLTTAYPRSTVKLITRAGHFSWIDRPEAFANLMAGALKR
jgi:proline iminopeptidase